VISVELSFEELQTALYQRLSNDTTLMSLITSVVDHVSEDTPFPYVVIGEPRISFENTKNSDVQEVAITLHSWYNQQLSDNYGNTETYKILNAIYDSLKYKLYVNGWKVVRTVVDEPRVFDDIDNITKHGAITYRFTLQKERN
jgi:Protein of unknown function (DUF3168)